MKEQEYDPVFDTDGMPDDTYLWMWYCPNCHSTLPPFIFDKPQTCPYCQKAELQKQKVERFP